MNINLKFMQKNTNILNININDKNAKLLFTIVLLEGKG